MRTLPRLTALLLAGIAAAGCSSRELEDQLAQRDDQISAMEAENQELRSRMAQKEATISDMRNRLAEKPKEVVVERVVQAPPSRPAAALAEAGFRVDERSDGTAVVLEGGILFDSGQAVLTAAGKSAIGKLVKVLSSQHAGRRIRIEGHTDNQPIRVNSRGWKSNWDLSYARAKAVFDELAAAGVAVKHLSIACYADTRPRGDNRSDAGRLQNRRVEVLLEK
ncbi:MAG: OmpA family protein [Candidatus Brocadiae bacterium]|nr:OmpA family protein [Candidatus Brocadiia bacterium]